jgi:hypothetical protein
MCAGESADGLHDRRDPSYLCRTAIGSEQGQKKRPENYLRHHDCFLSKVPFPLLTRRAIFP